MGKNRKEKSILFRIWKGAKKGENDLGIPDEKTAAEGTEVNTSPEDYEDFEPELSEEEKKKAEEEREITRKSVSNQMKLDNNYLNEVRRECLNEDDSHQIYYSDFMMDGSEPDKDKKAFIHELQATAKDYADSDPEMPVNAQVCIKLSPDNMEVWIFIFPPKNEGKDVSRELIASALECSGVEFGVKEDLVKKMVRQKVYLKLAVAARGMEPVEGTEGRIIDHFPRIPYTVEDQDKKTVDFKNLNWLHPVEAGTVICDIVVPVEGKDGSDVTGRALPCKPIKKLVIPYGSNTELNSENQLVATLDGTLYYEKGHFNVKDVMNILSDVDLSVGNIDTIGNLEIMGDVLSGFSVQATGNIKIHGMVGCSQVIAGGNLKIGMGVKGCGEGLLQAGGDIDCSYIESCIVKARGNVTAGSIVNCEVSSDRNVESKTIIGGTIAALRQVHAMTVGNSQRRQTTFYLGNTQEVRNEKLALEADLELLTRNKERISKNIRYLQNKETRTLEEEEECEQLMLEYEADRVQVEQNKKRLDEINEGINDFSQCELTANVLYPPTTVIISSDTCVINREQSMCRIWLDEGEIVIS